MKARTSPDRSGGGHTTGRAGSVAVLAGAALLLAACSGGDDVADPGTGAVPTSEDAPAPDTPETEARETTGAPETDPADGSDGPDGTTATETTTSTDDAEDGTAQEVSTEPPTLEVEVVGEDLSIPWDVQLLPDGTALVTEREGRVTHLADGRTQAVDLDLSEVVAAGEGGLMGLAVSPDVEEDRTIFLCHTSQAAGTPDVRVTRWTLDEEATSATQDGVVVDGLPYTSGRHSGCRLALTPDGDLLVGTGDAADSPNPQDLRSLGGKVLSVTTDGEPTDPDGHVEGADPRILTYGHRNVQGLALQPGTDTWWSVEHGPDVDDEVNVLEPGGNYGWDPGPGYDEGVPMTDLDAFPDAVEAVWSSGDPTHATSGAVFLEGPQWGAWDGALAVAELKGSGVSILTVDGQEVTDVVRVPELDGTHGRLRSLTLDGDGALWVTTSNGDSDVVLRVTATRAD